jgi:hypothetical protein
MVEPDPSGNLIDGWYYTVDQGWAFTDDVTFPYVWDADEASWLRFARSLEGEQLFLPVQ